MPFVHLKIAGQELSPAQVSHLRKGLTAQMGSVLGKATALTSVLIEQIPVHGWSIGGSPVQVAAHLAAKITAGTNTLRDKARYIAEAHALLTATLGDDLPLATYVVIEEVTGDAWGYGGLTQDYRRHVAAA